MRRDFHKLLVANRGEIAVRVLRSARELGLKTVAIYSEEDEDSFHSREADERVCIGPAESQQSYLNSDAILAAAKKTGAEAIHPGYGFLSEKESFAKAVETAGLHFVGPRFEHIAKMGDKVSARNAVAKLGLPIVPGSEGITDLSKGLKELDRLLKENPEFRFPLLVKATGGGGGKGMRLVRERSGLKDALERAQSESIKSFQNPCLFVERFIEKPRHIEVQVFGDGKKAVHLFERECSLQRRHQKVVEEALSPSLRPETRATMTELARSATEALGYRGAGTIEFIVSPEDEFFFLEMNTRIQVEHPVTEWVTQTDLIREQLLVALGNPLSLDQAKLRPQGHAIELRLYAEDAENDFLPQPGQIHSLRFPQWAGVRVDSSLDAGGKVSSHYDPMIAKISVWGTDRAHATTRAELFLQKMQLEGCVTNRAFLLDILRAEFFKKGVYDTGQLGEPDWRPVREPSAELIAGLCLKDYLSRAGRLQSQPLSSWQSSPVEKL